MASRLKRSNCPKWKFFLKNNKILMYLLSPFILQNLKRILRADPESSGCAIFRHKMAHLSWTKIFDTNQYYYFHLLVGPFHCAKFTKNSYSQSKVLRMPQFLDPKWFICPKHFFFGKLLISFLSISPFHCPKFQKKSFRQIQSYVDVKFLDKQLPICPYENFFQKIC